MTTESLEMGKCHLNNKVEMDKIQCKCKSCCDCQQQKKLKSSWFAFQAQDKSSKPSKVCMFVCRYVKLLVHMYKYMILCVFIKKHMLLIVHL